MSGLKKFLILAVIVLLGIFAFQNQTFLGEMIQLKLFKYQVTLILGFWLVISFLCGAVIFVIVDLPRTFTLKRELRRQSQDVSRLQAELGRYQSQAAVTGNQPVLVPPNQEAEKRTKP